MELDGEVVGELTDCRQEDMFWGLIGSRALNFDPADLYLKISEVVCGAQPSAYANLENKHNKT